ncbi:hypothetical protein B0H10DRAFT_2191330 [Mycena sp. CBHHK59/15]|nr:hypothetical protein B0H10DRAFT_2191330 [Mycena sp. CBHHK59/15]
MDVEITDADRDETRHPTERRLIARVDFPFQVLSTDRAISIPWKLSSEVATMRYVKAKTSIPVPTIYFYDDDIDGKVGGPWMLMEYIQVAGRNLLQSWKTMNSDQKRSVSLLIADYWSQLLSLHFDAIGSLCFDENGGISVGPLSMMCSTSTLAYDYPPREDCGPFVTPREWIMAMANKRLRYKTRMFIHPDWKDPVTEGKAREAKQKIRVEANVSMLSKLPLLYKDSATHPITLAPPDFRIHNVLVSEDDPTVITGVIDWEGTVTAPIWDVRRPPFLQTSLLKQEERIELNAVIWERVGKLNPAWAEAIADGAALRDAVTRAKTSDFEPESLIGAFEIDGKCFQKKTHRVSI